jgi:hypothetical protein
LSDMCIPDWLPWKQNNVSELSDMCTH